MLARFEDADGLVGYRSPLLAARGIPHVFTTRIGPEGSALDLRALDEHTRTRLQRAAGAGAARFVSVNQVHGANVLVVEHDEPAEERRADALVTARADVLVGVHVADCVPVLLARGDGRRVAAVHAGWRGILAGIVARALEALGGDTLAAIGPCIAAEAFEVGPEVAEAFVRAGLEHAVRPRADARPHVDLRAAAETQLRAGGVELVD